MFALGARREMRTRVAAEEKNGAGEIVKRRGLGPRCERGSEEEEMGGKTGGKEVAGPRAERTRNSDSLS